MELKETSNKVAELVYSGASIDLSNELALFIEEQQEPATKSTEPVSRPEKVGRWIKDDISGNYVKNPEFDSEDDNWSEVEFITPGSEDVYRIVLIGESVARCTHFPHEYCAARVVEKMLSESIPGRKIEVVDLAKEGMRFEQLMEVISESVLLNPDMVIVFAGNNWQPGSSLGTPYNFNMLQKTVGTSGQTQFIKDTLRDSLKSNVNDFKELLTGINAEYNIPVLYVMPEFNLGGFKPARKEYVSHFLPGNKMKIWSEAYDSCLHAEASGGWEEVKKLAGQMMDMDTEHPFAYEMMAKYFEHIGDLRQRREFLEQLKDKALINAIGTSAPRRFTVIRELVNDILKESPVTVVDLQEVLKKHSHEGIPGNELFLDYCHLNFRGIHLAMGALASQIASILGVNIDAASMSAIESPVSERVLSITHFQAAIHNYYVGQDTPLLYHHCCEALKHADDELVEAYHKSCILFSKRSSAVFSDELHFLSEVYPFENFSVFGHPRNKKLMFIELVDAMTKALQVVKKIEIADEIKNIRIQEYKIGKEPVDLLESPYAERSFQEFLCDEDVAYYRAHETRSSFICVADASENIELDVTARIPDFAFCDINSAVKVYVNGDLYETVRVCDEWTNIKISIKREVLGAGVNKLEFVWPVPEKQVMRKLYKTLSLPGEIINMIYYTFAEMFAIRAVTS
ncbi:hypothetical protein JMN32_25030 [Fulvivirga sp. 29W222]|uniref:SGNH hydrolase-type esterase domain-containing protein n=1 Tax=Fulvivirga marina TaxID=2494733 RepID=A0A937KEH5_9BACT|nr:hypothetical protein [Fulvivirga marina]MBL6449599.1 hypothetical protein [Fulvivirga marina]